MMGKPEWWPKNPYEKGTRSYDVWETASDVMCQAFFAYDWDRQAEVRERKRAAFVAGAHWSAWAGSGDAPAEALRRYGGEA